MAAGTHWEWRGFGVVSSSFADRYAKLESPFSPQDVEDLYLWIPRLEVNAKFRKGAEGGLKFKRLKSRDGGLEQWHENPEELFDFPLEKAGWDTLATMLAGVNVTLAPYPSEPPSRMVTLASLEESGCRSVLVRKRREGRLWRGPNGKVKVEWACISQPQTTISIGLETWDEDSNGEGFSDDQAREDILSAIEELCLDEEPLKVMNYMDAVAAWASGGIL